MKRVLLTLLMSVFVTYMQAQDRTVSGKVTDETGQPLPQVTVFLKGTTTGTPTDVDGNYRGGGGGRPHLPLHRICDSGN